MHKILLDKNKKYFLLEPYFDKAIKTCYDTFSLHIRTKRKSVTKYASKV